MRLTKEQHKEIIELYTNKVMTQTQLAKQYGVSSAAISKLVNKPTKLLNHLTFAFVGSRSLIQDEYSKEAEYFFNVVTKCAKLGINFRSGGANGTDYIAECAYYSANVSTKVEVYVPDINFNKYMRRFPAEHYIVPDTSTLSFRKDIIRRVHPAYNRLTPYALQLHCRSVNQISGDDLEHNVNAVVCWTPNGEVEGGTRTAIVIAEMLDIPVFNLGKDPIAVTEQLLQFIDKSR